MKKQPPKKPDPKPPEKPRHDGRGHNGGTKGRKDFGGRLGKGSY